MGYEYILVIRWSYDSFEGKMAVLILIYLKYEPLSPSQISFSSIEPIE